MNQHNLFPFHSKFSAFESMNNNWEVIQNMTNSGNLYGKENIMNLESKNIFNTYWKNQNYSSSSNNANNWSDEYYGHRLEKEQGFINLNHLSSHLTTPNLSFKQTEETQMSKNGLDYINQILLEKYCICDLSSQWAQMHDINKLINEQQDWLEYPKTYQEKEELHIKIFLLL